MPDRVKEKMVELLNEASDKLLETAGGLNDNHGNGIRADHLIANGVTVQECPRPLEEWHEDYGDVLWWKFPVEEPPYVGSPLCEDWPAYHTHWTPIVVPQPPKGE